MQTEKVGGTSLSLILEEDSVSLWKHIDSCILHCPLEHVKQLHASSLQNKSIPWIGGMAQLELHALWSRQADSSVRTGDFNTPFPTDQVKPVGDEWGGRCS